MKADYFTCKKNRVTFILAILVFTLHISSLGNYELSNNFGNIVCETAYVLKALAQVAVPLFFVLSGALFYRNWEISLTKKIRSRCHTLLIPYFLWNIIWTAFSLMCTYIPFISKLFVGRKPYMLSVGNLIRGVFLYGTYVPLWFIFDLILFTAFCPLIFFVIKNKKVGIVTLTVMIMFCVFGYGIPSNIFYRKDALIYYLAGALIGRYSFDLFQRKSTLSERIIAIPIASVCVIYFLSCGKGTQTSIFVTPVLLIYCFAFWVISDFFVGERYYVFETESFLIFAMHLNVGAIFAKILYALFPKSMYFAPINYVLTIISTVCFIRVVDFGLKRYTPCLRELLTGQR